VLRHTAERLGASLAADSARAPLPRWCFFEERLASLFQFMEGSWETARYAGGTDYSTFYKKLARRAVPPMSPTRLEATLRSGRLSFSVASDVEVVVGLYRAAFVASFGSFLATFPGRTNIFYHEQRWGDAEAVLIAETLEYAAAHCTRPKDPRTKIIVHVAKGNHFSDDGLAKIIAATEGSQFRLK
jgi:hypothetical protein